MIEALENFTTDEILTLGIAAIDMKKKERNPE
jgi:hypothetical protein